MSDVVAEVNGLNITDLARLGVTLPNVVEPSTYGPHAKLYEVTFSDACRCNVPDDVLLQQININIRRGLFSVAGVRPRSANSASAYATGHKSAVNAMGVYADRTASPLDDPKVETISSLVKRRLGLAVGIDLRAVRRPHPSFRAET